MNIAICDNDHACAEKTAALLKRYLSREQDTLTVFKNSGDLLQAAEKTPFDVLFLEIRLKGMDGLAAAARIRALHSRAIILFVSSYPEYAIKAFQVKAFRFLEKPLEPGALGTLWQEIRDEYLNGPRRFSYRKDKKLYACDISEIAYIQSNGNFINICMVRGDIVDFVNMSLKAAAQKLADEGFVQISKGVLVNLLHVRACAAVAVSLNNGELLPVKTTFKKETMEAFKTYCDRHYNR